MRSRLHSSLHYNSTLKSSLLPPSFTSFFSSPNPNPSFSSMAAESEDLDDCLCSSSNGVLLSKPPSPPSPSRLLNGHSHVERAWAHWNRLGAPKFVVAPMVDNSELPFRMLCRKYGAKGAYTPMLHSRIFSENEKYRSLEFTTCQILEPCLEVVDVYMLRKGSVGDLPQMLLCISLLFRLREYRILNL